MAKNNKEYYHNKAEKDKTYSPPHGLIDSLTTWNSNTMKRHDEENASYNKGWKNNKKQTS